MSEKPPSDRPAHTRSRRHLIIILALFVIALGGALVWGGGLVTSPKEGDLNSESAAGGKDLKPQSF